MYLLSLVSHRLCRQKTRMGLFLVSLSLQISKFKMSQHVGGRKLYSYETYDCYVIAAPPTSFLMADYERGGLF